MFSVISSIKLRRFWWNLVNSFLNKFAAKAVNVFHLTWIMLLHYLVKLEILITQVLPLHCKRKKLQNLFHLNCGLQIHQIWIQSITACGKYCKRDVQNMHHWSAAIDDATDEWLLQWRRDPAWYTPFSVTVSVHPDQWCVFCTPSLALFPRAVSNCIQIWRIWRPQLRWNKFWSFFIWQCSGSTVSYTHLTLSTIYSV